MRSSQQMNTVLAFIPLTKHRQTDARTHLLSVPAMCVGSTTSNPCSSPQRSYHHHQRQTCCYSQQLPVVSSSHHHHHHHHHHPLAFAHLGEQERRQHRFQRDLMSPLPSQKRNASGSRPISQSCWVELKRRNRTSLPSDDLNLNLNKSERRSEC